MLAMQHLDLFDLKPPFYYFAPHRIVNRDHARVVSALRRAAPPLRLRHEPRPQPSRALDVGRLGAGAVRPTTRATSPPPSRACWRTRGPSGSSPARRPTTSRSRRTRGARRCSSRSACGDRDQDRRPHRRREPRRRRRGQAHGRRRLSDDYRSSARSCRATRSAPASSRRAATRSSRRISASRPTTPFTRRSG